MGLLLSILFSYVGAVELIFVVRDIVHQIGLHHDLLEISRSTSVTKKSSMRDLQEHIRKSIKSAQEQLIESDGIQSMADGIQYEQGYRISSSDEQDLSKRWLEARANATVQPAHSQWPNGAAEHSYSVTPTNEEDSQRRSSSISVETVVENRNAGKFSDANDLNEDEQPNNGNDAVTDIHFDEYSSDYMHALDGIKNQGQAKNDEMSRRRKNGKGFSNGNTDEPFQRRRSEDIDGATDNPWGELRPESFHDATLWQRERAMSIAENEEMMAFADEQQYGKDFKREIKQLNSTLSIDNDHFMHDENKNVRDPFLFSDLCKYLFLWVGMFVVFLGEFIVKTDLNMI